MECLVFVGFFGVCVCVCVFAPHLHFFMHGIAMLVGGCDDDVSIEYTFSVSSIFICSCKKCVSRSSVRNVMKQKLYGQYTVWYVQ